MNAVPAEYPRLTVPESQGKGFGYAWIGWLRRDLETTGDQTKFKNLQ